MCTIHFYYPYVLLITLLRSSYASLLSNLPTNPLTSLVNTSSAIPSKSSPSSSACLSNSSSAYSSTPSQPVR